MSPQPSKTLKTKLKGAALLQDPRLNKGAAFTREEREKFELVAHLPSAVHSLDLQVKRAKGQLDTKPDDLGKHAFLVSLREQNEVLFYRLLLDHLTDLLPIIYTPVISEAIQQWSSLFRRPEGAYLTISDFDEEDPKSIERLLATHKAPLGSLPEGERDFDLVIVTDAGQILGIGDQGVGGIAISIGKGAVYSAGAGVDPSRVLSVVLDVGTDNQDLLNDELYLGLREKRTHGGPKYDGMVDAFVRATQNLWPGVFVHFEDFGRENAARILDKYRPDIPCFNDDIQGTGCVVLATILASMKAQNVKLKDQTIIVHGAGTAGMGISEWIVRALKSIDGVDEDTARAQFYLVDKQGLLLDDDDELTEHQKAFARPRADIKDWKTSGDHLELIDVVKQVKPTIIIGTSAQKESWTEELVKTMVDAAGDQQKPIFLPLSNPTRLEEATPDDIIKWSCNKCHVATGSPFKPVDYDGKTIEIGEANNALCYPTLGFSTIISGAKSMSDSLILAGVKALAELSPLVQDPESGALLPNLGTIRDVTVHVAMAMVRQALEDKVATAEGIPDGKDDDELRAWVKSYMWSPDYPELERI